MVQAGHNILDTEMAYLSKNFHFPFEDPMGMILWKTPEGVKFFTSHIKKCLYRVIVSEMGSLLGVFVVLLHLRASTVVPQFCANLHIGSQMHMVLFYF